MYIAVYEVLVLRFRVGRSISGDVPQRTECIFFITTRHTNVNFGRYESALREEKQDNERENRPAPLGIAAVGGLEAVASSAEGKVSPDAQAEEKAAANARKAIGSSSVSCPDNERIPHQQYEASSIGIVEERLQATRQELREVRSLHGREAKEVAVELTRVIEAHRARVATLEEKLRRTRRKIGAMARPKPTARRRESGVRGGDRDRGGGTDDGDGDFSGALFSKTPLSEDELLNLLTAADEEAFEAKGRAQGLEYELHAKNAEVNALLLLREGRTVTSATIDQTVHDGAAEGASVGGSATAGAAPLLSPSHSAATAAVAAGEAAKNGTGLASVACYARLAFAETEVQTLRDRNEAFGELVTEARREASALRLAAHRKTAGRADESRSREKGLRRQVSAYKREAERLRSAAAVVATSVATAAGKNGRVVRRGGVGARVAAAGEQEDEATISRRRAQQLVVAREESERRGRTIVSLRAVKTALGEEVQRLRQEATGQGEKLARALKDVRVKGNMVIALREKLSVLEAEIVTLNAARANAAIVGQNAPVVAAADNGRGADATTTAGGGAAVVTTTAGFGNGAGIQPPTPPCDITTATIRELTAERDRLRANMRGWRGSLSKKTAEIRAQAKEIERLEGEAGALRSAVARKEDAYRITKKQVSSPCGSRLCDYS